MHFYSTHYKFQLNKFLLSQCSQHSLSGVSPHLPVAQSLHAPSIRAWTQPEGQWGIRETSSLTQPGHVFWISMITFLNKRQCWSKGAVVFLGQYGWEIAIYVQTHLCAKMLNIYEGVCVSRIDIYIYKNQYFWQQMDICFAESIPNNRKRILL